MFAAIPLAFKIGGPIVLIGILLGSWYLYKDSIRDEGRTEILAEQREREQQQQAVVDVIERAQYDQLLTVVERTAAENTRFHQQFIEERNKRRAKDAEATRLRAYIDATKTQRPDEVHHAPEIITNYVEVEREVERTVPCVALPELLEHANTLSRVLNTIPDRPESSDDQAPDELAVPGS